MKKYRPKKAWIISSFFAIMSFIGIFFFDGWRKYAVLIAGIVMLVALFANLKYWFAITEDRIVIRQWVQSSNKAFESYFKIKTIMFTDISTLDIRDKGRGIAIGLKNGDEIYMIIAGYFNRSSIIAQVYEVKKKVYEMKKQLY